MTIDDKSGEFVLRGFVLERERWSEYGLVVNALEIPSMSEGKIGLEQAVGGAEHRLDSGVRRLAINERGSAKF